ncbi:unnamed protein product [Cylicocyclus nassatus]|uniref:Gamma tubulin complex component C-terminal domain-containing protein n=1 Tax=Cylicocyclus nassatus TaxID=53992 RepID=A0AA36GTR8_CYLNA|nr:unnamed protein product [Cylicocyclus nassatus]
MNSQTNKQSSAVNALAAAFECQDISTLTKCANIFSQSNGNAQDSKDVARFHAKMNAKDPRFANLLMRTIDALRASPHIRDVDALVEVLFKCRMQHIFYSRGRERQEVRGSPMSPYFSRRSASRGKLHKIDNVRSDYNNHIPSASVSSPQTPSLYNSTSSISTPLTSANNPLFGSIASASSTANSTQSNDHARVLRHRSSMERAPLQSRMGTVATVAEKALCTELCGALVGLEGSYFRSDAQGYMRVLESCSLLKSQKSVVESILTLAHMYADIVRLQSQNSEDFFVQAFCTSSQDIIEEYIHDVGEIPVICRPLTLIRVAAAVEVWRDRLTELRRLHNLSRERGTTLLERMHSVYSSVWPNFVVDQVMHRCSEMLCRSISRLVSGCEVEENDEKALQRYPMDVDHLMEIPSFLSPWTANYIMKIEKSWKSMDCKKNTENLDKAKNIIATQLTPKAFYLLRERYKLERVVSDVCSLVCGNVVRSFVKEYHIMDHFDAARCFLLLHDPTFSLSLYQKFCESTHGLRSKLSQRDASNALVAAAAMSPIVKRFPFRVNLDTLSSVGVSLFVQPLHPFYHPAEPVLKIFSETDRKYEALFQFVWPVEMCLFMLSESTTSMGETPIRRRNKHESSSLRLISSLLTCAERVLLRIRIYIVEMVNQWFKKLRCWIDEAIDYDSIVDAHLKYLDGLTTSFFLQNDTEEIYGIILSIIQISYDLCNRCNEFFADLESNETPSSDSLTQFAVIRVKLQKILPTFIARVQDLAKQQNSTAYATLIGIGD